MVLHFPGPGVTHPYSFYFYFQYSNLDSLYDVNPKNPPRSHRLSPNDWLIIRSRLRRAGPRVNARLT